MNESFTITGGVIIGNAHATYPFVNLYVDANILKINASIVGNLVFQPKDVISIETYRTFPGFRKGIKINHRVETYSAKVLFLTFRDPTFVINEIRRVGFLSNQNSRINFSEADIVKLQQQGSFPLKKSFAILFVVLWNLLFLSDFLPFFLSDHKKGMPIGNGVRMALGLVLATAILTLISENFRKLILKEGRVLDDIIKAVYFIILITGFLIISFSVVNFGS